MVQVRQLSPSGRPERDSPGSGERVTFAGRVLSQQPGDDGAAGHLLWFNCNPFLMFDDGVGGGGGLPAPPRATIINGLSAVRACMSTRRSTAINWFRPELNRLTCSRIGSRGSRIPRGRLNDLQIVLAGDTYVSGVFFRFPGLPGVPWLADLPGFLRSASEILVRRGFDASC